VPSARVDRRILDDQRVIERGVIRDPREHTERDLAEHHRRE
jgi:hypothetical protein